MLSKVFIYIIKAYQLVVSPLKGPSCRFYPTYSQYGIEALSKYGAFKGSWLTARRVVRCHPFHPGGFDPVP